MPGELEVRSAQDLLDSPLASVTWLVEELIPTGLVVLAGTPKVGKSWFCLWLAICVSTGQAFLDHATERAGVLYLCLEDTFGRIQNRLFHLVDVANDDLRFAIMADKLNNGLTVQLERYVSAQPTTRLIIIDTLQKVRVTTGDSVYASDYQDIGLLKACVSCLFIILAKWGTRLTSSIRSAARTASSEQQMNVCCYPKTQCSTAKQPSPSLGATST